MDVDFVATSTAAACSSAGGTGAAAELKPKVPMVVATKDIAPGEEIFIRYGSEKPFHGVAVAAGERAAKRPRGEFRSLAAGDAGPSAAAAYRSLAAADDDEEVPAYTSMAAAQDETEAAFFDGHAAYGGARGRDVRQQCGVEFLAARRGVRGL